MYLKCIEVQGFKSFANKLRFDFHNGITGIVGPNGSGKSNVADAVRWVLGEQSARQLRGGNMQDVIFSGTELRKPLGYASVAITLDNSDHKLDSSYEEVTVARRLYRSGESEYLMNGAPCRLRDVQELFYDTGIGKEGYSIIGQGQIDKILSNKPEDRRELFDEAVGIVKFKRRKNTTLKKLNEEEQNLLRLTDIVNELTRQLGPLKKQSETAMTYLNKRDELRLVDVNAFLLERERMEKDFDRLQQSYGQASEQLNDTQLQLERTRQEYAQVEADLEALETRLEENRQKASRDALVRQELSGQIRLLEEQILTGNENRQIYEERLAVIEKELDSRRQSMVELEHKAGEADAILKSAKGREDAIAARIEAVREEISAHTRLLEEQKASQIDILNQKAMAKGKLQRYDAMLEQINIRKSILDQRIIVLKNDENKQQDILIDHRSTLRSLTKAIEENKNKQLAMTEQIDALQVEIEQGQKKVDDLMTTYHRESSRFETLKNLAERYDGYGSSVRRVMERKPHVPGLIGVVADLIKTDKRYETAVETALGGTIQNIVTEDEDTARTMIEYLKTNRFGRATFLPLSAVHGKNVPDMASLSREPGVIRTADQLVRCEDRYKALMRSLLGRTLVVDTIEHAIAIARKNRYTIRIVTLEGELLNPGGSMTGGAFKNSGNLLGRRREMEELEKGVRAIALELQERKDGLEAKRNLRNTLREEVQELVREQKDKEVDLTSVQADVRQAQERIREITSTFSELRTEGSQIEGQIREVDLSKLEIDREMKALKATEKDAQKEAAGQEEVLETLREKESGIAGELEAMHLEMSALNQQAAFHNENMTRLQQEIKPLEEEKAQIHDRQLRRDEEEIRKKEQIEAIMQTIAAGEQEDKKLQALIREDQLEKENLQTAHRSFFEKRDELSDQKNLLDRECIRIKHQLDKLEESQETGINYLWENYQITPMQADSYRMETIPDRAALKRRQGELKEEIRNLGPVNVNAIEEYAEVEKRHAFLSEQHSDLIKAQETLQGIIRELDEGMRKQFAQGFKDINREFDLAFKQLFGGGKGTLELVEDEDILEAGVRIIAQPPGKKLQNMMQLSGGEKALTAIALLFAIQNMKPSPFCLLDEIEAALDDSNVGKFSDYLHKLSENTQFIVITHRRGTMNAADRLYGITMQEKGVSTLVSVDLIEHDLDK